MSIDRRSFIRGLSRHAVRSVGAALSLRQELRQEVIDQLRQEAPSPSPDTAAADEPAPTAPPVSAARSATSTALGAWANHPASASRLLPNGVITAVDQRALPGSAPTVEMRTVRDVVEAMRLGVIDGGLGLVQAAAQALALAAVVAADAPRASVLAVVRGAASALAGARPDVPLVGQAVEAIIADAAHAADEPLADHLRRRARELSAAVRSEHIRLAAQGADWLDRTFAGHVTALVTGEFGPVATGSIGTTSAILRAAADRGASIEVWVPDGEPEGRSATMLADALAETAAIVHRLPDVRIGRLLLDGRVQLVMLGASWVSVDGMLAGEMGSSALAVLAKQAAVPVVGVASGSMLVRSAGHPRPAGRSERDGGIALDLVEARWLGSILTDAGLTAPSVGGRIA